VVTGRWQDLIEHSLDVAIFGGDLKDCSYRALSVGKVAEIFCASPRYLKQNGLLDSIYQLSAHRFIATPWQNKELQLFDNQQKNKQMLAVEHCAKTNSLYAALEMAVGDMGIMLYPEFLAKQAILSEQLVRVLPEVQGRAWHFYFLHQYQKDKPIHVDRFYQLICHYFKRRKNAILPFYKI
jgi:DNA-binding transcriptional LysR family regulator